MKLWLENKGVLIADEVMVANTFFKRLRGWLGKTDVRVQEALFLIPCSSIHTFGMKTAIDVLYLNKEGRILSAISVVKPNRIVPSRAGTWQVVELRAGKISELQLVVGDQVLLKR